MSLRPALNSNLNLFTTLEHHHLVDNDSKNVLMTPLFHSDMRSLSIQHGGVFMGFLVHTCETSCNLDEALKKYVFVLKQN
jgi:hypothetical protein